VVRGRDGDAFPRRRRPNPGKLAGDFVIAGFAAGLAIVQAVFAKANFQQGLAEAAVFFAVAVRFRHLALHATVFLAG
jgi:hypothetical protein